MRRVHIDGGGRLAIDFGTSNTVAVLAGRDGRIRPLVFDGSELLPSGVWVADGRVLVGRDAEHAARADPAVYEPHPKRCCGRTSAPARRCCRGRRRR
jgi:molecular chaperone DnaK (HSP70)